MSDPIDDTMLDRLEERVSMMLEGSADLAALKLILTGETNAVPVDLYPYATVFLELTREATGEEGYGELTGMRYFLYDGYVSIDVLARDAAGIRPTNGKRATVPSYGLAKRLTKGAWQTLFDWGAPDGRIKSDPVNSYDAAETTVELMLGDRRNGVGRRRDNVTNRGSFDLRIVTRRMG